MFPLSKTLASFTKAKLIGLMIGCAFLAVFFVVLLAGSITWLAAHFITLETSWLDTLVNWLVGAATGIIGWFMLPVFVVLIAGMFQGAIINRVEKAYYPDHFSNNNSGFWPDLFHDVKFTLWALFLNILVLPLYLFGIGFIISILLNSYLLGREFFESAAGHHLGKPEAKQLGRQNKNAVYGGGLVITLLALIPVVNMAVPVFATVWMVHVFHSIPEKS